MPLIQPVVRGVGTYVKGTGGGPFAPGFPEGVETGDMVMCWIENGGTVASESAETESKTPTMESWVKIFSQAKENTRLTIYATLYKAGLANTIAQVVATNHTQAQIIAFKKNTFKEVAEAAKIEEALKIGTAVTGAANKVIEWLEVSLGEEKGLYIVGGSGSLPDASGEGTEFSSWESEGQEEIITERADHTTLEGDGGSLGFATYPPPAATKIGKGKAATTTSASHVGVAIGIRPFLETPKTRRFARMIV